jgi:hypothetical protein
VKLVRLLKKRHGDRHLVLGRRQKPKKGIQDDGESREKLAAASRGMTRHADVVRRKGHFGQGQDCAKNPERTDVRDETSSETRGHQRNKEPRLKTAATSAEGGDNRQGHQGAKQETGATSGKREDIT